MSKQILKVHISWKNDRTFYIETDSAMTSQEVENYVSLLKNVIERQVAEYNQIGNVENSPLYDFMIHGVDTLFPLPPQNKCSVTSTGEPFEVEVEWNAEDSTFEDWQFPQ